MSEPKKCPMTFNQSAEMAGDFSCIQEKCAWWVKGKVKERKVSEGHHSGIKQASYITNPIPGHCVALDWRKK